jgi:quercetin dioxygenase-like cupin family protein
MLVASSAARGCMPMSVNKTASHCFLITMLGGLFCAPLPAFTQAEVTPVPAAVAAETLLREAIEGAADKEVIVSRVSFPANTELPWHWHPGEEIFYVIEGAVTLARRGLPDTVARAGDVQKIAPKTVHAGHTGEEGAELVIFRVHKSGEPERYLVD